MSKVSARRVKLKFVEARENWASLSEVSFYKEDKLADKMSTLFKDENKTDVSEKLHNMKQQKTYYSKKQFMQGGKYVFIY